MKLNPAMYRVQIGINDPGNELVTDNLSQSTVAATDAQDAMRKVKLKKHEYYAQIGLIVRADR